MELIPSLPSEKEFGSLSVFPYHEGSQIEFKANLSKGCLNKLDVTLCAFLNTKGGHFIIGINDTDRKMNWLSLTSKEIDHFKLRIDRIFHDATIVDDTNMPLSPDNITVNIIKNNKKNILLLLQLYPNSIESIQLIIRNGID